MKRTYKVYILKSRESHEVLYVGMTRLTLYKRFNEHVRRKKLDPAKVLIELVKDEMSQCEAVTLEEMLIEQYKTRENGFNKAPKSTTGYSIFHSEEQKNKWSEERKGKPIKGRIERTGYKNSDEQNKKIGKANSKPLICLNNGKVYNSIREACKLLKLKEPRVSQVCNGKLHHTKGYKFRFFSPVNSL